MEPSLKEYLTKRFLYNNHRKYHKYLDEWINNLTQEQIWYFIQEKDRIIKYNLKGY